MSLAAKSLCDMKRSTIRDHFKEIQNRQLPQVRLKVLESPVKAVSSAKPEDWEALIVPPTRSRFLS